MLYEQESTRCRLIAADYMIPHVYENPGNEMRAISAFEVTLWGILGQVAGLPIYSVLGGASDRIKICTELRPEVLERPDSTVAETFDG
jgi:L-alanine-DL-glutamate epimerase-like enolase superfamily enzyme